MELVSLNEFIEKYWNNEDYKDYTFVFGNTIANRDMLEHTKMYIHFIESEYFPKVWGELREKTNGYCVGLQFDFTEVKILEVGTLVFHLKIEVPDKEVF